MNGMNHTNTMTATNTMNTSAKMNDKERMQDTLCDHKFLTAEYNTCTGEAATPAVWNTMMNILNDEHHIQQDVWKEMNSRGWYPVEKAEENKLTQAKQKFSPTCTSEGCKIP